MQTNAALLTCTDKMPSGYDIALLTKALKHSAPEHTIPARVQDRVFAVLLTDKTDPECIIRQTESSIHEMLGSGIHSPRLMAFSQPFSGTLSEAESQIDNAIQTLNQKTEACYFPDYKEQIHRLHRDILAAPQKEWGIAEIAKQIGISRSHLQRLYKELFQVSIMDDLIAARLSKARQLLAHTEMRIAEIAIECGYRSETHFMRQFKEKTGITATQFRTCSHRKNML